jgi:hypothetical protein
VGDGARLLARDLTRRHAEVAAFGYAINACIVLAIGHDGVGRHAAGRSHVLRRAARRSDHSIARHAMACRPSSAPLVMRGVRAHERIRVTAYFSAGVHGAIGAHAAGRRHPAPPRRVWILSHPIGGRGRETGPSLRVRKQPTGRYNRPRICRNIGASTQAAAKHRLTVAQQKEFVAMHTPPRSQKKRAFIGTPVANDNSRKGRKRGLAGRMSFPRAATSAVKLGL